MTLLYIADCLGRGLQVDVRSGTGGGVVMGRWIPWVGQEKESTAIRGLA